MSEKFEGTTPLQESKEQKSTEADPIDIINECISQGYHIDREFDLRTEVEPNISRGRFNYPFEQVKDDLERRGVEYRWVDVPKDNKRVLLLK